MLHGLKLPFQYVVALALVTVAGKLGDALGPVLAVDWPLTLLFLNANDLHLGLTAADTDLVPWLLVGTFRRIVEDPVFFLIGWHYREAAVEWLKTRYHVSDEAVEKVSRRFASISAAAVIIEPGAVVCTLAGAARMSPISFSSLNLGGTVARLVVIRGVAAQFPGPLQAALKWIKEWSLALFCVAFLVTAVSCWQLLRPASKKVEEAKSD
eukprot:TRINITY_DN30016_c0_g1_i2.p1 TRINITY_DN30016_c0_g1~~TRINITY_DN30016_c0_g1_i2.p1  ORF type:complete len:210 (-),score=25.60 TRINITY_DN30016_c0_g1_i2:232-861(-)